MGMPIKTKVAGNFTKALQARIEKWQAARAVGSKLVVPDGMEWLYWQEFGTPPYPIRPVNKPEMVFPHNGELQFRKDTVNFPGLKPKRSVTKTLPEIRAEVANVVHSAVEEGALDNPRSIQHAISDAASSAKEMIRETISQDLPGTREIDPSFGRLHGNTAEQEFDDKVQVVDVGEA